VSDYIDEVELYALVESHFPTSNAAGQRADEYSLAMNRTATKLARAVAERVRERARVCGRCSGAGWYQDDDDKSNTLGIKCPRCVRGVTFGGEA